MSHSRILSTVAIAGALLSSSASALAFNPTGNDGSAGAVHSNAATLRRGDPTDGAGRHHRTQVVQLRVGDNVEVALSSDAFDTTLRVVGHGLDLTNDDAQGEGTNSRLRFRVPASGAYHVTVSSYDPGETGGYQLAVREGVDLDEGNAGDDGTASDDGETGDEGAAGETQPEAVSAPEAWSPRWVWDDARGMLVPVTPASSEAEPANGNVPVDAPRGTGTVYGIFAGVSNYGGDHSLEYTADDARNLARVFEQRGLIRHGNAIVLTDESVTEENVRQAFQTIAPRVTARDTFVFFFDGHGNSNEVEMQSGPGLTTHALSSMLRSVRGQQLLVLDSCESGGFASIVRGHPDRVGLFSSRASESSDVANEVHAGGWLAYFMIQAVRTNVRANDGAVHLADLAHYAQRGYDQRVGDAQHLVVTAGANAQTTLWRAPARGNAVAINP